MKSRLNNLVIYNGRLNYLMQQKYTKLQYEKYNRLQLEDRIKI
jgi:hypothetical protein